MSESEVLGKGDHPLPLFNVNTLWEDWEPDFVTFLGIKNLAKQYHSADSSSAVQPADIFTKDLGRKVHRRHRDVLFGKTPIVIESVALPESQKVYIRRHNEELARKNAKDKLERSFKSVSDSDSMLDTTPDLKGQGKLKSKLTVHKTEHKIRI